jgi:Ca2+-binding RTX toxin-like protein
VLDGGEGDDTYASDPLGSDELRGSAGVDTVDLRDRTADLQITIGVGGFDDGQAGENDKTSAQVEIFRTGSGSDVLEDNWDDENTFETGAGNDTVYARRATDTFDGGDEIDTLSYGPFESPSRVYFPVSIDVPSGKAASLESGVALDLTFSNFERFVGGDKNDVIQGFLGPEYFQGLGGSDTIRGGLLGDTILGGDGDDTLRGEGGDDTLFGDGGIDSLFGDTGDDSLTGGTGKDLFDGGAPTPPDEETDIAADYDNALMESCADAMNCP